MRHTIFFSVLVLITVTACNPGLPSESGNTNTTPSVTGYANSLTQSEFDQLDPEDQYMVASKLMATMFRGVPLDEFADTTRGMDTIYVKQTNFMNQTYQALTTSLSATERNTLNDEVYGVDDYGNPDPDLAKYYFNSNYPHQKLMARIVEYPVSRDQFVSWMSYFLANTIMFSPAREMDSTDAQDISRVINYLELNLREGNSIRQIIRGWLHNLSRWRVSRSPENHALEMFELYLGLFETEEDSRNGGIACRNYWLTDNSADYQLAADFTYQNTEYVKVLDSLVLTCEDLYDLVAGHELLMPRVTEVIVNYFLDGRSEQDRLALVESIVNNNPQTFDDIFLAIIFSEEFLLNTNRPKTFEENMFGFLDRMHWDSDTNSGRLGYYLFYYLTQSGSDNMRLAGMGWSPMEYKIGRTPFLPMDVLSFANYHKSMREHVVMNDNAFDGQSSNYSGVSGSFYLAGGEDLKPELDSLTAEEFIDFVFLSALGRRATDDWNNGTDVVAGEKSTFITEGLNLSYLVTDDEGIVQLRRSGDYEYWTDNFAEIMLDYISRLPEFYYFQAVQ